MTYLAIDTSAHVAVSLLDEAGTALAARVRTEPRMHAELASALVQEMLAEAGLSPDAVQHVIVGTGPAPFTGLRVGLVTGRVFGFAVGAPVHGVCSLDALAAQAVADLGLTQGQRVAVASDARRREVYLAQYQVLAGGRFEVLAEPQVLSAPDAAATIPPDTVIVGAATQIYPDQLPATVGAPLDLDPVVLAQLGRARILVGGPMPHEPLYLRRPDVTVGAPRKRVTV